MLNTKKQLIQALGEPYESGDEILFFCPFCSHRKRKLSINSRTFFWKCWVCEQRGRSLFSLFWKLGKRDECHQFLNVQSLAQAEPEGDNFKLSMPDGYRALVCKPNRRGIAYLKRRCVTERQILQHKIGYCETGRFKNRVVLPSFAEDGSINFFTSRAIAPEPMRYLNAQVPQGYIKSIVLNALNIDWRQPIVLVEGFFDMLRVNNSIPLFGSALGDEWLLFQQLVMRHAKVTVCLDDDARKKQLSLIQSLNSYGLNAYDMRLRCSGDLAEASDDAIAEALQNARPLTRLDFLREKIHVASR